MSWKRKIQSAMVVAVVLLPTMASLCRACLPCAARVAAETTVADAAMAPSAVTAHASCHESANDGPRLLRACCCAVDAAGPMTEAPPQSLHQQFPTLAPLAVSTRSLVSVRRALAAVTSDRAPPRARDRLSLHQSLLI